MADESNKPQTLKEMAASKQSAPSEDSNNTAQEPVTTQEGPADSEGIGGGVGQHSEVKPSEGGDGDDEEEPTKVVEIQEDPNHSTIKAVPESELPEKKEEEEEQEPPTSKTNPDHVLADQKPAAEATVDPNDPKLVESGLDVGNIADPAAAELAEQKKSGSLEERLDAKTKSTDKANANTGEATGDVKVDRQVSVNPEREVEDPSGSGAKHLLAEEEGHRVPRVPYGVEPMSAYVPTPHRTDLHGEPE